MLKKIYFKIYNFLYSLFGGMANTEIEILGQKTNDSQSNSINQTISKKSVAEDLLKGELTQEVKELRYRTYLVDREAKQYEYFSPTLAKKTDKKDDAFIEKTDDRNVERHMDSKFILYENEDNLELITIQENKPHIETVYEALYDNRKKSINEHTIKIERDFLPNFLLESFTKRIVVKKISEKRYMLDFYVTKYVDKFDLKSKPFIRFIEKTMNTNKADYNLEFNKISFITNHAYKLNDMLRFTFKYPKFYKIVEFDGHYVIKFKANAVEEGFDLTKQYYCKSMDDKYKKKERKNVDIDITGGNIEKEYVCDVCGKHVKYSTDKLDRMDITENASDTNNSEYMDLQISEQTFGKKMCHECLNKYLNEI